MFAGGPGQTRSLGQQAMRCLGGGQSPTLSVGSARDWRSPGHAVSRAVRNTLLFPYVPLEWSGTAPQDASTASRWGLSGFPSTVRCAGASWYPPSQGQVSQLIPGRYTIAVCYPFIAKLSCCCSACMRRGGSEGPGLSPCVPHQWSVTSRGMSRYDNEKIDRGCSPPAVKQVRPVG